MKKNNSYFLTEGDSVYYQNNGMKSPKKIPNVDIETFQTSYQDFAFDKNHVYAQSTMAEGLQIFTPEDITSVIYLPENIDTSCFVDDYNLYRYNGHFISYRNITAKSESTLKIKAWLKKNYPNRKAWWNRNESILQNLKLHKHNIYTDGIDFFYKFKAEKYYDRPNYEYGYQDFVLPLAYTEKDTFETLNNIYSKDKNSVYFYSKRIKADASTFQVMEELFARDKSGIWYNGRRIEIEDSNTFQIINTNIKSDFHFAKNQYQVYASSHSKLNQYSGYADILRPLIGSDSKTFVEINDVWAKDKNNVYWYGKIYPKGDAKTFEKVSDGSLTEFDYASDKNHVYIANGQTIKKGLHGGSFKVLNEFWAVDDFVVYFIPKQRIIKVIDRKTFKIMEKDKAEDDAYYYEYKDLVLKKTKK